MESMDVSMGDVMGVGGSEVEQSGGGDVMVEQRIAFLNQEVAEQPTNYTRHIAVVEYCREHGELVQARRAREKLSLHFPLHESLWLQWIDDELKFDDADYLGPLFERAVKDYFSVELWLRRMTFEQEQGDDDEALGKARAVCKDAVRLVGSHVKLGAKVWRNYIEYEKAIAEIEPEKSAKIIRSLYERALSMPLYTMEHLRNEYTEYEQSLGEKGLKECSFEVQYQQALKKLEERRPFEEQISDATDVNSIDWSQLPAWAEYVTYEKANGNPVSVEQLYQRCVKNYFLSPDVWVGYLDYMETTFKAAPEKIEPVYKQLFRNIPGNSAFRIRFMQFLEREKGSGRESLAEIDSVAEEALSAGLEGQDGYQKLFEALIDAHLRAAPKSGWGKSNNKKKAKLEREEAIKSMRALFSRAIDFMTLYFEKSHAVDQVEAFWADVECFVFEEYEAAASLFETMFARPSLCYSLHHYGIILRGYTSAQEWDKVRAVYRDAVSKLRNQHDRTSVNTAYRDFERQHGTLQQVLEAEQLIQYEIARYEEVKQELAEQRQQSRGNKQNKQRKKKPTPNKSKRPRTKTVGKDENGTAAAASAAVTVDNRMDTGGDARENAKQNKGATESPSKKAKTSASELKVDPRIVLVSNIPEGIPPSQLRRVFSEFGEVIEVRVQPKKHQAYVEFEVEDSAQASIAKSAELLGASISGVMGDMSLRTPEKKKGDAMDTGEDSTLTINGQTLIVISAPGLAPVTGAKEQLTLVVFRLNFKTSEQQLKQYIETVCPVKSVRIPAVKGKSKGFAYIECFSAEDMQKIIEAKHDTKVNETDQYSIKVEVSKKLRSKSKDEEWAGFGGVNSVRKPRKRKPKTKDTEKPRTHTHSAWGSAPPKSTAPETPPPTAAEQKAEKAAVRRMVPRNIKRKRV
eukprot:TRINITY_DN4001_c0_g1_i1.p1 TRINITY_DN4001_c0_g1~~TRINITY_DN4001_c0_g1_i1.p1  ORF type:complete len:912 (-),score=197.18 TRINITY_DN4001_c0_g1_i1:94-2829(-)